MTIYEQLGGHDAVSAAVSVFYGRVTDDELLSPWFEGVDLTRLKAHQRSFLAAAFGGPDLFAGRDLTLAHRDLAITDEAYDRLASTLVTTLADLGTPSSALTEVSSRLEGMRSQVVTA